MRRLCLPLVLALGLAAYASPPIYVAAASSLGAPLKELAYRFVQAHAPVRLVLASSGKLFWQIEKGAPYDLYLPADPEYLAKLPEARLLEDPIPIAVGRLALYLNPRLGLKPKGPEVLLHPKIRRIALPNPRLAPYGRAGLWVLKQRGLYSKVRNKLVYAENVAEAARLAAFAADAGWVDLGSAQKLGGPYWLAPLSEHPPLLYAAGLLSERGRPFLGFLQTEEARKILRKYGLETP